MIPVLLQKAYKVKAGLLSKIFQEGRFGIMVMPQDNSISVEVVPIDDGIFRLVFSGTAGIGSKGNVHGTQMHDAVRALVERNEPRGILIDFCQLNYQFGNYIGAALLGKGFPRNRMCVLADGETLRCLRSLWDASGLNEILPPIFDNEIEAIHYITRDIEEQRL